MRSPPGDDLSPSGGGQARTWGDNLNQHLRRQAPGGRCPPASKGWMRSSAEACRETAPPWFAAAPGAARRSWVWNSSSAAPWTTARTVYSSPSRRAPRSCPPTWLPWDSIDLLVARNKLSVDYVRIERSEIKETGEYNLEGLFVRIRSAVEAVGARRIVLDSIESLFAGLPNPAIVRSEMRRLFRWLKERKLTAIVTAEKGHGVLTRQGLEEYVSDCVIVLEYFHRQTHFDQARAGDEISRLGPWNQPVSLPDRSPGHLGASGHLAEPRAQGAHRPRFQRHSRSGPDAGRKRLFPRQHDPGFRHRRIRQDQPGQHVRGRYLPPPGALSVPGL